MKGGKWINRIGEKRGGRNGKENSFPPLLLLYNVRIVLAQ